MEAEMKLDITQTIDLVWIIHEPLSKDLAVAGKRFVPAVPTWF